jgi:ABC-type transport system involved in multi-copper enzyme maturation permease subunit
MTGNILRFELRLSRFNLICCGAGTFLFQGLLVAFYAAARPDENFGGLMKIVPRSITTLFGGDYLDILSVSGFLAYAFTHPLNLLLLCTPPIALASRTATGGAEDGRTDLILSQPVSRTAVFLERLGAGAICSAILVLCMWLGHLAGITLIDLPETPDHLPFVFCAVNALFFVLSIQGIAFLAAAVSRVRGTAVGIAIGILAAMFFLRLAAGFWNAFDIPARLSVFTYYIPARVVLNAALPVEHLLTLTAFCVATAAAGLAVFNRKDI